MKEIKDQYKQTLLINLLDLICAGRENQTHWVASVIKSIEIRRHLLCPCVFNFGSAADVENGSGRLSSNAYIIREDKSFILSPISIAGPMT